MIEHVALGISVAINVGVIAWWAQEWAVALGGMAWVEWQKQRHNARLKG